MKKIDLSLNYTEICARIEADMGNIRPSIWADKIKVSINVVSNIHGEKGNRHPSIEYAVAVSRATGKPIEWYLFGDSHANPAIAEVNKNYKSNNTLMYDWPEEHLRACRLLKEILDSGDDKAIGAILFNLEATKGTVRKNSQIDRSGKKAKELKKKAM